MHQGSTITMTKQIQYFSTIRSNIVAQIASEPTYRLLSKSIFLISSGGNDIFAYFTKNSSPNATEKVRFIGALVSEYENHLKVISLFPCILLHAYMDLSKDDDPEINIAGIVCSRSKEIWDS